MDRMHSIIRSHLDSSIYEYGFADLTGLLAPQFSGFTHGISVLRKLDNSIIDAITDGPTREYFNLYNAINNELNDRVGKIAAELTDSGMGCRAMPATVEDSELDEEYRKNLAYVFSHKLVATRAGLGWIGKTDLLISKRFGPRVRLASIITEYPLEQIREAIVESQCGNCSLCVDACPGQVATGKSWNVHTYRNEFFDPFKCRDYCRKISGEKLGEAVSLCGKCIQVCPRGQTGRSGQ
jgi:epoxyqueuosine reductase